MASPPTENGGARLGEASQCLSIDAKAPCDEHPCSSTQGWAWGSFELKLTLLSRAPHEGVLRGTLSCLGLSDMFAVHPTIPELRVDMLCSEVVGGKTLSSASTLTVPTPQDPAGRVSSHSEFREFICSVYRKP